MFQPLSSLLLVASATRIRIQDDWNGLSLLAPIKIRYDLQFGEFGWTGSVRCSFGHRGPNRLQMEIQPQPASVEAFLKALAAATCAREPFDVGMHHTDDYPDRAVWLRLEDRSSIRLRSISQERNAAPWTLPVAGETWYCPTDDVYNAIRTLTPQIGGEVVSALKAGVQKQFGW